MQKTKLQIFVVGICITAAVLGSISFITGKKLIQKRTEEAASLSKRMEAALAEEDTYLKEANDLVVQYDLRISASAGKHAGQQDLDPKSLRSARLAAIAKERQAIVDMGAAIVNCRTASNEMIKYSRALSDNENFDMAVKRSQQSLRADETAMHSLKAAESELAKLY